jgi:uncharacterized protein YtpQ (UPF0354 family)
MKRIIQVLLTSACLLAGCSKSDVSSPTAFTQEFAEALRQSRPGLTVEITGSLQLNFTSPNGHKSTAFLDNAYAIYKQNPASKTAVMQKYISSQLEAMDAQDQGIDRNRVVPVIKDRGWLAETRKAMLSRGAKSVPSLVFEDFSPDLIIVYAEDSPKNISYIKEEDLKTAKIDRADLRKLACQNLLQILPKIERQGGNGIYMMTAGGDYEASLLLIDSIWSGGDLDVKGNIVVAIPTRDLLLVTGSEDADGIGKMKKLVKEASNGGSYKLTQQLFVYRNGKFEAFGN